MYNHQPENYTCPFCKLFNEDADEINNPEFIVYEDETTVAFISPKWWPNNPGNVLVIPKEHVENIYDISDELLGSVYKTAKKIAIAIKETYKCDATSMRQHNEPDGNQDVWHFHIHVFPRYKNDELYKNHDAKAWTTKEERLAYVQKLKQYFHNEHA